MNAPTIPTVTMAPLEADVSRFVVGDSLTVYTVDAFRVSCLAEFDRGRALVIDLGAVRTCDSLGMQVLHAAKRTAAERGTTLRFENVAPAVRAAGAAIACDSLFCAPPCP